MKWFGADTFAPVCEITERVQTPVGEPCGWCEEPIEAEDFGVLIPHIGDVVRELPFHEECNVRMIMGSLGHQRRECSCYGEIDRSEEGKTRRQAAKQLYQYFQKRRRT